MQNKRIYCHVPRTCFLVICIFAILFFGFSGCYSIGPQVTNAQNSISKGTIGLLWNTMQVQVCVAQLNAAKARVKELGYNYIEFDSNWDVAKQQNGMENMIAQKVDAIVMIAVDGKGIIPAVEKANAAGIPVITQDNTADGGKIFDFIATDNYRAAEYCADYINWKLKGKGNIVVLSINTTTCHRSSKMIQKRPDKLSHPLLMNANEFEPIVDSSSHPCHLLRPNPAAMMTLFVG